MRTHEEHARPRADYDPAIYASMREAATRLGGYYVHRCDTSTTEEERQRWLAKVVEVQQEADSVDPASEADVLAKTEELRVRYAAEDAARPADG